MKNKKKTGSYYTPEYLSDFIVRYTANYFQAATYLSVLEPSVGDGSFVTAFNSNQFPLNIKNFSFTALDKILSELRKAEAKALVNKKASTKYSFSKLDFLKYQDNLKRKFSLIVGNPPYIKKGLLNNIQRNFCKSIHESAGLADKTVKNIWSAFLVRCTQLLNDDGILAFVLPAELLQVQFAAELRQFLSEQFVRTEIFTFDDLLFECKGQDTVVLIGFKSHQNSGQYYAHIEDVKQLRDFNFNLTQNAALSTNDTKWTHHFISAEDLNFIHNIANRLRIIDHYCDSKPGIVTAANEFFIVNQEVEQNFELTGFARPIIQKGLYVNGSVVFSEQDYDKLVQNGIPAKVLCFNDEDAEILPNRAQDYINLGEELGLQERYKCKKRKNWFVIPNISNVPQGFFFKRSHFYPKLLKNEAQVFVTDSGYKIEMRDGFNINHLIYSFYNSLTLAFAELTGRYYGGGVLELTPREFKKLPIPNIEINFRQFNAFVRNFENKTSINEILALNDFTILNTALGLTVDEIHRVNNIYRTLISKRLRNNNTQTAMANTFNAA